MKWQNITSKGLRKLVGKLDLQSGGKKKRRRSDHEVVWYCLDGKKVLRVTMPNVHGGSGSMSTGFLKQIKNQLMVNFEQFGNLVACPLSADEFEAIIREKLRI